MFFRGETLAFGGKGDDTMIFLGDDDIGFGRADDDTLYGLWGNDLLAGGSSDDFLSGGSSGDLLFGGSGDDEIEAGFGDDVMIWIDPSFGGGVVGKGSFDGGFGSDTLYLVTDRAIEFDVRSFADMALGLWEFEEIGVFAEGVEKVKEVTGGPDAIAPEAFAENVTVAGLYVDAGLWNLV